MSQASRPAPAAILRAGRTADLDALLAIEQAVFTTDRLSPRSFRHFFAAPSATLIVAEVDDQLAGYVLVLYPPRSRLARLYSIAVLPRLQRRGLARQLLAAAETRAASSGRNAIRLEVREDNPAAIELYEMSGYRRFGRYERYYDDRGDAVRFEKPLDVQPGSGRRRTQKPA